ncbi:alpha/beta hydrolase [Crossiella sp. SN42]|uniref:alpha/beta fold hydrolase n=1 Tax=Crossiella sp. SN42 TaxID=2944808 RepID=UPI00207D0E9C|nr:alpha/beta hydrolase [Crossiella sp. SN42]MCO1579599.1 alpha/beta hydrolase [Crossiella sp. SN42]
MAGREPGRTPIVLVHGIRVSGTMWQGVRAELGDRPVSAPDLPGHGSRRGERFTVAGAVAAITDAVDDLGGQAVLVGHSMGSYLALAAAAEHPERISELVLVGGTLKLTPGRVRPFRRIAGLLGSLPDGGLWFTRRMARLMFGRAQGEAFAAGGVAHEAVPDVLAGLLSRDPLADLRGYPGPVRLVNGRRDHFRAEEAEFLAACQRGRLALVPKAGHLLPLTHPRALAELLTPVASA